MIPTPDSQTRPLAKGHAFVDIDQQASCLAGYDQRYTQIGHGQFFGSFWTAPLDGGGLVHFEEMNRTVLAQAGVPRGTAAVGFMMASGGLSRWNGVDFDGDSLVLMNAGDSLDAVIDAGARFCVIEIPSSEPMSIRRGGHSPVLPWAGGSLSLIREWANRQLRGGTEASRLPSAAEMVSEIFSQARSVRESSPAPRLNSADRHRLYRKARDWMQAHAESSFSMPHMCRSIGASRRAVEYAFEASVGTSPSAFLKTARLNLIRRDLAAAADNRCAIGDVAARWGLWHPSRFAADYRNLFGELPSETVQRVGCLAAGASSPPAS